MYKLISYKMLFIFTISLILFTGGNGLNLNVLPKIIQFNLNESNSVIIYAYYGIPYAMPPIGDLRFLKSKPLISWNTKYKENSFKSQCFQKYSNKYVWYGKSINSEDCLYLNIWTPHERNACQLPVMVWFHGGGLNFGSINLEVYDGQAIAAIGHCVVVTVAYRLNIFGFYYANSTEAPGNMGLWDQRMALQWVRENIGYFGGDPKKVTIFGESSGADSVIFHLLNHESRILFKRGIIQSSFTFNFRVNSLKESYESSLGIAKQLNCSTNDNININCLRSLPSQKLIDSYTTSILTPEIYGDDFLKNYPIIEFISGSMIDSQILIGINENEPYIMLNEYANELFNYNKTQIINVSIKFVETHYPKISSQELNFILNYYYGGTNENDRPNLIQAFNELLSHQPLCTSTFFAGFADVYGNNNAYFYYFNENTSLNPFGGWNESTHFQEVQYVFGMPFLHPEYYNDDQRLLSRHMILIWTSFARDGTPDPQRQVSCGKFWPMFKGYDGKYVTLNSHSKCRFSIGMHKNVEICKFWINLRLKTLK